VKRGLQILFGGPYTSAIGITVYGPPNEKGTALLGPQATGRRCVYMIKKEKRNIKRQASSSA